MKLRILPLSAALAALLVIFQPLRLSSIRADEATDASDKRLKESATYLASDELEGRGVGTRGLNKAAAFLAAEFAKLGLKTDSFDGSPFQKFRVTTGAELGPSDANKLLLQGPPEKEGAEPKEFEPALNKNFTPLAMGGSGKVSAPLVFVGYGITAKDLKKDFVYDDYAGIDVKGKVVVIIRKEPQQEDNNSIFDGVAASKYAPFQKKIANATEHGAVAVIFVNDRIELKLRSQEAKKQLSDSLDALVQLQTKYQEVKEPSADEFAIYASQAEQLASTAAESAKLLTSGGDYLLPYSGGGENGFGKIPVYFCLRETMEGVIKAALGKDLATIEKEIDADLKPQSKELAGWTASGEANILRKEAEVKNVIAVLEGEGPLAHETIVVGAHYDHLGFGGEGSLAPWTTTIHNGADDNASGTSTLLEVATRMAQSGKKPRRRIVFMAFTGEERGLLGSKHYVKNPRFALENTIAMYNLDMVGRLKDNKLAVYGTSTAKHFDAMVEELSKQMGFVLTKYEGGFGPSDHSSFYSRKIPVLHFFTGTHTDYHRPSDDAEKLNIEGMRRVADMLAEIIQRTDATDARPEYVEIKKFESIVSSDGGGERTTSLGTMPDYNTKADGVVLELVMPGGPAEKAGLKPGDILVKFGDLKISNIEDFENALRTHKPGDKVKLKAKRGAEEVELEATLGTRRRQ